MGPSQAYKVLYSKGNQKQNDGEGNGNPLQYTCLENPMGTGTWLATVHGVARVRNDLVTKPPFKYNF